MHPVATSLLCVFMIGICFLLIARKARARLEKGLTQQVDDWNSYLRSIPQAYIPAAIILACAGSLFIELAIIRLHGQYLQVLSLLKNVSLLSCFLGFGVGFLAAGRRLYLPLQPLLLAAQLAFLRFLLETNLHIRLGNPIFNEEMLGTVIVSGIAKSGVVCVILFIFLLNVLTFVPLGQLIAVLMERLEGTRSYRNNLLGSLLGIAVFFLLSSAWTGGPIWLAVYGLFIAPFFFYWHATSLCAMIGVLASILVVAAPFQINRQELYSPYQTLSLTIFHDKLPEISTNSFYYQRLNDLRESSIRQHPELAQTRDYYELAYSLLPAAPSVLIVGSGTGNDVAAALRRGASEVTAVEIDPVIAALGKSLHPETPYSSERVDLVLSDARAHIKRNKRLYDAVVYGLLDSHTLLSGRVSGLRLDSYVYTVEGFREARAALKPDGLLVLSFVSMSPESGHKLYLMLKEAFDGAPPLVLQTFYDGSITLVAGRPISRAELGKLPAFEDVTSVFANPLLRADMSTDDWPYLYMPHKTFPLSYLGIWIPIMLLSIVLVRSADSRTRLRFDLTAFLLGAAFMLLETKAFTEMSLSWGSTFYVTTGVIFAILSLALLANEMVYRKVSLSLRTAFSILLLTTAIGFGSTYISFAGTPWIVEGVARALLLTLPIFFAGICFSNLLTDRADVPSIMGSNLLGAMFGGFLEYTSMALGFRALYLFVGALYLAAFLSSRRSVRQKPAIAATAEGSASSLNSIPPDESAGATV